ncbi:hypothetical protein C7M61_005056 [Candidozyma pseudohaemuli]|uniref:Uncharacterized protein n=1 Tax=Candidozyma pseudohaemuli TaxID=418784 RepID=A0A2P7YD38_9ASCO|nr:hypothetical protein C7M61_005056 [[Candida] pseudohaemulonii]PSK33864.1 hypothetical protein C7M61_005056 [[Candida] pseudohaemulonii]
MTLPQHSRRFLREKNSKTSLQRILGRYAPANDAKINPQSFTSIKVNKNTSTNQDRMSNMRIATKKNAKRLLHYCSDLLQQELQQEAQPEFEILTDRLGYQYLVPIEVLGKFKRLPPVTQAPCPPAFPDFPQHVPQTQVMATAFQQEAVEVIPAQLAPAQLDPAQLAPAQLAPNRQFEPASQPQPCSLGLAIARSFPQNFQPPLLVPTDDMESDDEFESPTPELLSPVEQLSEVQNRQIMTALQHFVPEHEWSAPQPVRCIITENEEDTASFFDGAFEILNYLQLPDFENASEEEVTTESSPEVAPSQNGATVFSSFCTGPSEAPASSEYPEWDFGTEHEENAASIMSRSHKLPKSEVLRRFKNKLMARGWNASEMEFLSLYLQRAPPKSILRNGPKQAVVECESGLCTPRQLPSAGHAVIDEVMINRLGTMELGDSPAKKVRFAKEMESHKYIPSRHSTEVA